MRPWGCLFKHFKTSFYAREQTSHIMIFLTTSGLNHSISLITSWTDICLRIMNSRRLLAQDLTTFKYRSLPSCQKTKTKGNLVVTRRQTVLDWHCALPPKALVQWFSRSTDVLFHKAAHTDQPFLSLCN